MKKILTVNNKIATLNNAIISKTISDEPIPVYNIGDVGPSGGLIFYINENYETDNWKYLEAAPSTGDTVTIRWSNISNSAVTTTSTLIGSGYDNTLAIINQVGHTSSAAKNCNDAILNTYDDWFLPSQSELDLMYRNLHLSGIGYFTATSYWSSSEVSATNAYRQTFNGGAQSSQTKSTTYRYRPIRKFKTIQNYTVTYDGNEYTNGILPVDNNIHIKGSDVLVLSGNNLKHYDDTFICWNTQSDGFGTDYYTGTTFKIASNTTLYAKWSHDTIIILPDTQSYVKYKEEVMTSQLDWIVNNKDSNNIKFVGHVGDIIQDYGASISQWQFAKNEMSKLTGATIPYAITFGNHDYLELTRNGITGNTYFPLSTFQSMSTYQGSYDTNCENTYHTLNIKGEDILLFLLEFGPRQSVIDWANNIIEQSGKSTILITHAYLSWYGYPLTDDDNHAPSNGYGLGSVPTDVNDGIDIFNKMVVPNNEVNLIVCGHDGKSDVGSILRITGRTFNNTIYELMSNFQYYTNYPGYFVILKFLSNKLYFRTYSPYLQSFKTDQYSQGDWKWFIGSLQFQGITTSYLEINNDEDLRFRVGDFTVEWFQYQTDNNSYSRPWSLGSWATSPTPGADLAVSLESGNFYLWINSSSHTYINIGSIGTYKNTWVHFAVTRENSNVKVFKNGTQLGNTITGITYDFNNTTDKLCIGGEPNHTYNTASFGGYITNFRWIKGKAVYTNNFSIPTNNLLKTDETKLLFLAKTKNSSFIDTASNKGTTTSTVNWSENTPY